MSGSRERQFEDFEILTPSTRRTSGRSTTNGDLFIMKKKPITTDDDKKQKYQNLHFVKRIHRLEYSIMENNDPKDSLNQAIDEVRAQELLRLLMPTQPKTRILFDKQNNVYVQSKEIPGLMLLANTEVKKQAAELLSPENYGTKNGLKGLGELFVNSLIILQDGDFKEHNIGFVDGQIYKIDAGRCFHGAETSNYLNEKIDALHNENFQHPVFLREYHRAILKFILLPDSLLNVFKAHYNRQSQAGKYSGTDRLTKVRDSLRKAFTSQKEFMDYVSSQEALTDLEEYKSYLKQFKFEKHNLLLLHCPNALNEMDAFLLDLRKSLSGSNNNNPENAEEKVSSTSQPQGKVSQEGMFKSHGNNNNTNNYETKTASPPIPATRLELMLEQAVKDAINIVDNYFIKYPTNTCKHGNHDLALKMKQAASHLLYNVDSAQQQELMEDFYNSCKNINSKWWGGELKTAVRGNDPIQTFLHLYPSKFYQYSSFTP